MIRLFLILQNTAYVVCGRPQRQLFHHPNFHIQHNLGNREAAPSRTPMRTKDMFNSFDYSFHDPHTPAEQVAQCCIGIAPLHICQFRQHFSLSGHQHTGTAGGKKPTSTLAVRAPKLLMSLLNLSDRARSQLMDQPKCEREPKPPPSPPYGSESPGGGPPTELASRCLCGLKLNLTQPHRAERAVARIHKCKYK